MSQSSANLPGAAGSVPSLPLHFIPHQIQRQLPTQRPPTQATFVTMSGGHSSVGSSGGNHGIGSNITGKSNLGGQSSSQVNYTVTPMQVPATMKSMIYINCFSLLVKFVTLCRQCRCIRYIGVHIWCRNIRRVVGTKLFIKQQPPPPHHMI